MRDPGERFDHLRNREPEQGTQEDRDGSREEAILAGRRVEDVNYCKYRHAAPDQQDESSDHPADRHQCWLFEFLVCFQFCCSFPLYTSKIAPGMIQRFWSVGC